MAEQPSLAVFSVDVASAWNGTGLNYQANHQRLGADPTLREEVYFTKDQFSITELQYTTALVFIYDEEAKLAPSLAIATTPVNRS